MLKVAVAAPLPGLYDYLPPPGEAAARPLRGVRVRVPFGRGSRIGFVWSLARDSDLPLSTLKPVRAILDSAPLLPEQDLALLKWAADYYQHPLGEVLQAALPLGLRGGQAPRPARPVAWRLSTAGQALDPDSLARAPRQAAILRLLGEQPSGVGKATLYGRVGPCAEVLQRLIAKDWIEECEECAEPHRLPDRSEPARLNPEQQQAVAAVARGLGRFGVFLLDGITGSGKTEVYLKLIERVLGDNGQVLILVPEIGLTPQLQRRLARRISAPIALLHSSMAQGEREQGWWRARAGEVAVVLGTRSAVFAPMPRLALILVDEEHDLSLKQQDGLRYSARDLAVRRAQQRACPVLLGSATPSLESLLNARLGRYRHLRLSERAGGATPPRLDLVDVRTVQLQSGLSPALIRLLRENLAAGQQSLLFLNRRGYAPQLTCHACGWVAGCPSCDARLTLHQASALLWCHHCGYRHPLIDSCPQCAGTRLLPLGQGTERLETTLERLFQGVPIARIDRDSTRRRGSLEKLLGEIHAGRYPLLLGTQMLAKGHHFPDVTLVAILDVDQGLYGADFRAAERMSQLIVQVAGRAGRADKPGRVIIQTRHPDHPLLQTLIHRGYGEFARLALQEREQAALPPYSAQALLRAEAPSAELPEAFLQAALAAAAPAPAQIQFWGPVPAPMQRRAGRYRAHLLLQADNRRVLQGFLQDWTARLYTLKAARKVRWSLDVDPQEML